MKESKVPVSPKLTVLGGYTRGIVACFLVLLSLMSCIPAIPATPAIDVEDGGFLSEDPCGAPCFWGIVPGETTEAEVTEILQERDVFATCEAFDREDEAGHRGLICGFRVIINFERGGHIVQGIGYNPSSVITVQEAVAKYGEPEGVRMIAGGVNKEAHLVMVYSSMLTKLRLRPQEGFYVLEPSTEIENIAYDVGFGALSHDDDPFWEEWHGYGEY